MGILEVNQIKAKLHENYDSILELGDLSSQRGEELERNFLSRALAAYSINILYPHSDQTEVVKYIVDGPDDNGIDLIFYHKETNELCFTQSKFNNNGDSEPDLGEIKKFVTGVKDLINVKFDKFNEKVNNMNDEITAFLNKSGLRFKIILIYTAINLSTHARREFEELLDELNDFRQVAEVEIINQKRIHSSLSDLSVARNIDVEVQLKQWGRYEGEMESFYGQISADQLAEWWESYGNGLYEYNLRKLLGTTDINNEMKETLETEPELFWYYNNGVTLVCEEVDKKRVYGNTRDLGLFECKGISIVNGAQTVGVIGKFGQSSEENKETLRGVYLPFRIISMQTVDEEGLRYLDENFASEVTTKNNRQNKIDNRDFVVLDPIQKTIENTLAIDGITYHLMRGEGEDISSKDSFNLREATRALSFAKDIDATILVSREIGVIYSDLNHARYKKLFNPGITGYYVWNCVLLQRRIEDSINSTIKQLGDTDKAIMIHGKELVSRLMYDLIGTKNISKNEIGIKEIEEKIDFKVEVQKVLELILPNILTYEKSIVNIFKSPNDIRSLYDKVFTQLGHGNQKIDTQPINDGEFDVSEIESLPRIERVALIKFYNKIKEDDLIAKKFFKRWIKEIYDPRYHNFTYSSNIQFYFTDEEKQAKERFLFRIAYYTKLIVSFEFNVYGSLYKSILFEQSDFEEWARENTDSKGRVVISTVEDIEKVLDIAKQFILTKSLI
ncbi:AIPR family protein [Paenibacillus sp. SEL3]|uniref:AIPR family protein n=1 Tax=Paenibacillus sp. FSL P4-0113 TaxID=2921630 RepID=UPI0030F99D7A